MIAILVRQFGGPDVLRLEEVTDPVVGPGQVRVRVRAVGVNPFDTYMRAGGYAISPPLPYIPGADAAGVVDQVGDGVTTVTAGDRVYIGGTVHNQAYGAYASLAVCHPHQVHPLPARASFAQGAAMHVPYVTAWRGLFERAHARPGDTVFVHGATGGVGLAAVQLARAAGLTVIGSAGTAEGVTLIAAQGTHHQVNHRAAGYMDEVKVLTGGAGPDIIIEMLANVNLDNDLALIARSGRIVIIGNRGRVEIDPRRIMGKDAMVSGMALWNTPADDLRRAHLALVAALESGAIAPVIGTELPLAEAARAHAMILEPGSKGKIVLVP
jgi:NADPH2:quinone reductase